MRKIALSIILFSALINAGEVEYGTGTFNMKGGFLGMTGSVGTDVDTFSYVERHSNLASDFFYGYDFTWLDSQTLKQAQHTYNGAASTFNGFLGLGSNEYMKIPSMDYRVKGMDANIRVGYDVIHEDADNFLGIGALVGLSMPWIDSSKSNSAAPSFDFIKDNAGNLLDAADYFQDTETEVMTFKIGPTVTFQKSLIGNKLSVYGGASYAYQTGYIDNSLIDSSLTVNGTFQEYNLGLYFTPFTETFEWGWLSLSPRIYGTVGYKYSKWDVDEVAINISGFEMSSDMLSPLGMEFSMDSSVFYTGVGYSF